MLQNGMHLYGIPSAFPGHGKPMVYHPRQLAYCEFFYFVDPSNCFMKSSFIAKEPGYNSSSIIRRHVQNKVVYVAPNRELIRGMIYIAYCCYNACFWYDLADATVCYCHCQSKIIISRRWPNPWLYVRFSFSCVQFEQMMMNVSVRVLLQLQDGYFFDEKLVDR